MIYVTGDIHGGYGNGEDMHKLSVKRLKENNIILTENDYLVILGDFGLPFLKKEIDERKGEYTFWIKWLSEKPCTILWVDGNHENFEFWENQPITEWNGGKVQLHPKASNVIHLMRGEVYEIEGKKIFAFGGAMSHDKERRICDKNSPKQDWWEQETCSVAECENAIRNLEKHEYCVDYVFTHTPPAHITVQISDEYYGDRTALFLSTLSDLEYKVWCSGHVHKDFVSPRNKFCSFYQTVMSLSEAERRIRIASRLEQKEARRSKKNDKLIC